MNKQFQALNTQISYHIETSWNIIMKKEGQGKPFKIGQMCSYIFEFFWFKTCYNPLMLV